MEPEFIWIAPLAAVAGALVAVNVSLFLLRIAGKGRDADQIADQLMPYVRLFKLGGRDGEKAHTRHNQGHHEHA